MGRMIAACFMRSRRGVLGGTLPTKSGYRCQPALLRAMLRGIAALSATLAFASALATPPLTGVAQISAGGYHSCAVTSGGAAKCWGYNFSGQLGNNSTIDHHTATQVSGVVSSAAAIAAGDFHTCAVTTAGGVQCWGSNFFGQLGNDSQPTASYVPVPVTGMVSGTSAVVAGEYHTCALSNGGGVQCWGRNAFGEVGDGGTTDRAVPVPVSGLSTGIAMIAAGSVHTCALTIAGGVQCWGSNAFGQLGDNSTNDSLIPLPVSGLSSGVASIAAGAHHTCAVTTAGGVLCWGQNWRGDLGDGTNVDRWVPVPVSGLASGVVAIDAGGFHTCALTTAGGVQCWGSNLNGQLGDNSMTDSYTPVPVSGLASGMAAISTGLVHTCGVTTGGAALCWGGNQFGALGDSSTTDRLVPVPVVTDSNDAVLTNLLLSSGLLTPPFATGTTGYTATVTNAVRFMAVTPTAADPTATIQVNGTAVGNGNPSPPIALAVGPNTITVLVTAQDGTTTKTYAIVVTRAPSSSTAMNTVLWRHQYDFNYLWQLNVDKATPLGLPPVAGSNWVVRGMGDLDGDGIRDIIWQETTTSLLYVWYMDANGGVKPNGVVGLGGVGGSGWTLEAVADFNGDGIADFLWRHSTGAVYVWYFQPDGSHTVVGQTLFMDPTQWRVAGVGDIDGSGTGDIAWNGAGGPSGPCTCAMVVWLMSPAGGLPIQLFVGGTGGPETHVESVGDFDGDGMADVLWTNPATGENEVWYSEGTFFTNAGQSMPSVPIGFQAGAIGDFNGDGKKDVVGFNPSTGQALEWLMNGRGNTPTQNSLGNVGTTWFLPNQ